MNVDYINPFLNSISNVIVTMATLEVTPGTAKPKLDDHAYGDVSGIIGMISNTLKGSMALTFTEPAILQITSRMLGEEVTVIDDTVTDCVGEITNMVTGGAKSILADKGHYFDMATPVIISGKEHEIIHKFKGAKVIIPFSVEAGEFFAEICFEGNGILENRNPGVKP